MCSAVTGYGFHEFDISLLKHFFQLAQNGQNLSLKSNINRVILQEQEQEQEQHQYKVLMAMKNEVKSESVSLCQTAIKNLLHIRYPNIRFTAQLLDTSVRTLQPKLIS